MSSPDIKNVVEQYLKAVAGGSASTVAALYAADGTLEDPVGSEPKRGRADIEEFYRALESVDVRTELLHVRISGLEAAFHFRVVTVAGDQTFTIEPIDVMTFNAEGEITSMRAFWAPEDSVVG